MHAEMSYPAGPFARERGDEWWWARRRWMAMAAAARRHGGHHGRRRFGPGFDPWGGPVRIPGPFFGRGPKVGRGDVRAAIMVLLAEGPMHGYQIIQELTQRSGGVWRPSPGSVYPTLQLLEDEGLIRSEETEGRRVFHLTDAGTAEVKKRGEETPPPWDAFGDAGPLIDLREVGFGMAAAVMQVAQTGSERQIARAKEILTEARKSLYRLLAEDEPEQEGDASED
ncbi:MAG TPA: PadR family transcriptional regulator [Actinomycetota bacterium]|nr:PadR family transcriptional regulator [Actinomycetota bacterium]